MLIYDIFNVGSSESATHLSVASTLPGLLVALWLGMVSSAKSSPTLSVLVPLLDWLLCVLPTGD